MKLSSTKKIILYCTIIAIIIVISVLSQMVLYSYQTSDSRILPGVYVNNLYVGGKTKSEAYDAITNDLSNFLLNHNTKVINGDIELTIHASNIANVDVDSLVDEAFKAGRDNENITYFDLIKMKYIPTNIEITTILDWQNIYDYIELNKHLYYSSPINAQLMDYSFVEGQLKLIISPSQSGYEINAEKTATSVQDALLHDTETVYAIMDMIAPEITTESLMEMANDPIVYSQVFPSDLSDIYSTPSDLATLDNLVEPILIMPGQSISVKEFIKFDAFDPYIDSYKSLHAPSIIYGCALHAGIRVDEHHVLTYITDDWSMYPYGQEAVLSPQKDLILTNTFQNPVIMDLVYDNTGYSDRLVCKIYCTDSLEYTYIKSVIEEHSNVYYVNVYRVYANDTGGVLSRTLLEQHAYPVPPKPVIVEEETVEDDS